MKTYFLSFLLLCSTASFAQLESRYWIFGKPTNGNGAAAHMDFFPNTSIYTNSSNPLPSVVPPAISPPQTPLNINSQNGSEGWAVATEPNTGELLFYTDGIDLFDSSHVRVNVGFKLGASSSSAQAVLVCKRPSSALFSPQPDEYFIFVNPTGVNGRDIGLGPVKYWTYTPSSGGLTGPDSLGGGYSQTEVGEGMVIIPHPNLPIYWLILRAARPRGPKSTFMVYQIDRFGVDLYDAFDLGISLPVLANNKAPIGNFTFRKLPNSNEVRLAMCFSAVTGLSPSTFMITSFDPTNGNLSASARVFHPGSPGILYDVELSPSGRYLFFSTYFPLELGQMDLQQSLPGIAMIERFGNSRGGGLKLGPDGFIYHISEGGSNGSISGIKISRIIQPDQYWFNVPNRANFWQSEIISMPNIHAYNFPEFLPRFQTFTSNEARLGISSFKTIVHDGRLEVIWGQEVSVGKLVLTDLTGRKVWENQKIPSDRTKIEYDLPEGIYLLRAYTLNKGEVVKKVLLR